MSESSGSERKISPELIDEMQRSGRMVFLKTAGYTTAEITGFGDIIKLPEEKMKELLQRKTEKAIASLLGEALLKHPPRIQKLHGKARKRR